MSITLIGMPSCGKSTVGVLLAKQMGLQFIDSDLLIQAREGRLLHDIIAEEGIARFLEIEEEVNCSITEKRAVISTGGSAVYGARAMAHLATLGPIVYLRITYEQMAERLGDYSHRGVVLPEGYTLLDMYRERSALYEKYADVTVDGKDKISDTLGDIITRLQAQEVAFLKKSLAKNFS